MSEASLSVDEKAALDALVKAWNAFLALPHEHGDDITEFRHGIHSLQDKILARPARRLLNATDRRRI